MYLAYLDEAGDDGYPKYSSPLFVQTCIYMHVDQWRANFEASRRFRQELKNDYGIKMAWEIHTRFFVLNKNPYRNLDLSEATRMEIIERICHFIAQQDFKIVNVCINKLKIPNDDYGVLDRAVTYLIQRVENDLQFNTSNDRFLVITDEGRLAPMRTVTRRMAAYNPIPSQFGGSYQKILRRMVEDPLPKSSDQSYFIQWADFVSYLVYMFQLLELGAGKLAGRTPAAIDAQKLREWMIILSDSFNLKASSNPFGIVCYPK